MMYLSTPGPTVPACQQHIYVCTYACTDIQAQQKVKRTSLEFSLTSQGPWGTSMAYMCLRTPFGVLAAGFLKRNAQDGQTWFLYEILSHFPLPSCYIFGHSMSVVTLYILQYRRLASAVARLWGSRNLWLNFSHTVPYGR